MKEDGKILRIGLVGLGTVGAGVAKICSENADLLTDRTGRKITVTAISARNRNKDRGVDLSSAEWFDDPVALASSDNVDVVVEMIGGSDGIAKACVQKALEAGKPVVTANKALLAEHGQELAKQAEDKRVALNYEAAIAGGIPIVKALREGLAANKITGVYGILNGTCNYILTEMEATGRDFDDVLKDAQELGYAEADPTFDVDGIDAAHKLALLTSIAFGTKVAFKDMSIEGISKITSADISFAKELGFRIKLLGLSDGRIQSVRPCLVPRNASIAAVEDAFNAVEVTGNFVDATLYVGRGAGEGPTASAVVADIVDIARGALMPVFGTPASKLKDPEPVDKVDVEGEFYVRLIVSDAPGVMADVATALSRQSISIGSIIQHEHEKESEPVPVVLLTHKTTESRLKAALAEIVTLDTVLEEPRILIIQKL